MGQDISSTADVIDLRDVSARIEELEADDEREQQETEELATLAALMEELRGNGGDHDWRGSWYPLMLVRDSYFETYAREFADDIGAVKSDADWPARHIDWTAAAEELQQDYSSVEYEGETYWYR